MRKYAVCDKKRGRTQRKKRGLYIYKTRKTWSALLYLIVYRFLERNVDFYHDTIAGNITVFFPLFGLHAEEAIPLVEAAIYTTNLKENDVTDFFVWIEDPQSTWSFQYQRRNGTWRQRKFCKQKYVAEIFRNVTFP